MNINHDLEIVKTNGLKDASTNQTIDALHVTCSGSLDSSNSENAYSLTMFLVPQELCIENGHLSRDNRMELMNNISLMLTSIQNVLIEALDYEIDEEDDLV